MFSINNEALAILLFLVPGFLAFRIFTIDKPWKNIHILNIFYASLGFSILTYAITYYVFLFVVGAINDTNILALVLVSSVLGILTGVMWRRYFHPKIHSWFRKLRVSNEDNEGDSWSRIFNNTSCIVTQIIVRLKDGTSYMSDDTEKFAKNKYEDVGIYPYYSDMDQCLIFIPTHYFEDSTWKEYTAIEDEVYGVRLIYIRPEDVYDLQVRVRPA